MDPELPPELRPPSATGWLTEAGQTTDAALKPPALSDTAATRREISAPGDPYWVWLGRNGLRAGWSLALFGTLVYLLASIFGTVLVGVVEQGLHWKVAPASASSTILGESEWVAALAASMLLLSLAERRRVTDYYLADRRAVRHFVSGGLAGFAALSILVGGLAEGGWLHFGPVGLSGLHIVKYGLMWGLGFLFVGLFEEGTFRCYVQFTLTRGVNFWWAAGSVAAMCAYLLATPNSNGVGGIYALGLLGVGPCLWLHVKSSPGSGFWQAAWAGSTGFGFIHTFNRGETWIGIFAAAAIGFVFCVSVRVTGSAWWAIGCHTAWDWAESFFYGTADSGFAAKGHYLTTLPAGPALWSGGTDGPEGSVLVLPVIGLLLLALLLLDGRRHSASVAA
jgi:hypothetical protein